MTSSASLQPVILKIWGEEGSRPGSLWKHLRTSDTKHACANLRSLLAGCIVGVGLWGSHCVLLSALNSGPTGQLLHPFIHYILHYIINNLINNSGSMLALWCAQKVHAHGSHAHASHANKYAHGGVWSQAPG
jgi:hypothetical protein